MSLVAVPVGVLLNTPTAPVWLWMLPNAPLLFLVLNPEVAGFGW